MVTSIKEFNKFKKSLEQLHLIVKHASKSGWEVVLQQHEFNFILDFLDKYCYYNEVISGYLTNDFNNTNRKVKAEDD